jgi:hypothetical protein
MKNMSTVFISAGWLDGYKVYFGRTVLTHLDNGFVLL